MSDLEPLSLFGSTDNDNIYRMSRFELLIGWVPGFESAIAQSEYCDTKLRPRQAFEECVLRALQRPPCIVAFSGGRDSSAVLAVATHLARREGLDLPIPATHDFTGAGIAEESRFQQQVIDHLGIKEWHRVRDTDSFEILGERAKASLSRYGLMWPALIHFQEALVDGLDGGSLVTGEGGDQVLGNQRMTALNYIATVRPRPGRQTISMAMNALAPRRMLRRSRIQEIRDDRLHPWLDDETVTEFCELQARDDLYEPLHWGRSVLRQQRRRAVTTGISNLKAVLSSKNFTYHAPFLENPFVPSLARAGGRRGWLTRTFMMRMMFADLLPDEICRRESKARFGPAAIGPSTRKFVDSMRPDDLPMEELCVDLLRSEALQASPLFGVQMLVQAAWINRNLGLRS